MENLVKCKICGIERKALHNHIKKIHNMSVSEYYERFNCTKYDVFSKSTLKKVSDANKGPKNPAYNHGGIYSPFSRNFLKYDGLTDEEKDKRISEYQSKVKQTKEKEPWRKCNNNLEYFLHQGYSQEEAKKLLKDRQTTFSLEKCIKKYGEEKGTRIWKERQEKWQDTLKSKPIEEIERINKAKMFKNGFSQISQELFWILYDKIKDDFNDIYFAQLKNDTLDKSGWNNEYMIEAENKSCIFPDFLIKDNNKIIEFDGDYWHGKKMGNQERERKRDNKLINKGYKVLHIWERDYKSNPQQLLDQCKEFIYDRTT